MNLLSNNNKGVCPLFRSATATPKRGLSPFLAPFGGVVRAFLSAAFIAVLGMASTARAQYWSNRPGDAEAPAAPIPNPEIVDKANALIPQDLEFTRSDGKKVKLAELFNHGRPVVVSLVYFSCPSLCTFVQDDLVNAIRSGPKSLRCGKDYDVIIVSFDPDDTPEAAAGKRVRYLALTERPEAAAGLTYLTGTESNIRQLADTIGFGYRKNIGLLDKDPAGKYAHSAGVFICTANGRVSQTLRGLGWPSDKLHYALLQASDGKIGSGFLETVALPCGMVRLGSHGYEQNPWFWAGTATAGASLVFMGILLGTLWRREWRRKKDSGSAKTAVTP
jgi:protein SCO1